jgi:hypothetical protein
VKPRTSRDKLKEFSERAIEATAATNLVSPLVYLPRKLRGQSARLTVDNLKITADPETMAENHVRIADADPIGFLIAIMQGQPIPRFVVRKDGSVEVHYDIPTMDERQDIAKWLGGKVTFRMTADPKRDTIDGRREQRNDYEAMIKNRVQKTPKKD